MKRGLKAQMLDLFADSPSSTTSPPAPPLAAPAPPLAKRLNRNALTVAAVIMGMTVIACLVVLRGDSGAAAPRSMGDPTLAESPAPTFLERPVHATPGANASVSPQGQGFGAGRNAARDSLAMHVSSQLETTPDSAPEPATYSTIPSASMAVARPRDQAFEAALKRSPVEREGSSPAANAPANGRNAGTLADDEAHLVAYGDSMMRGMASSQSAASPAPSTSNPRQAFLRQAGELGGKSVIARLEPAGSPFVLRAGTVIPATLLTAITSDLPGDCMGQVSRDVYDSQTQRTVLIPKGSKLMCRYDDQVAAGQGRLLVAWTRLMLPDGRSMTLPGLALKDAQGQTGAKGDVDNHTRRVFGRALLLSAIGAGAQLSQPRQVTILAPPTTGQVMAGAVGQELSNVALEILRRGMDQPPTITVPQGQTFNVFLNGDLVFDGPYDSR
jgi:type IV secretion system protein TrbI